MAQNPKPTRKERRRVQHVDRVAKRLIQEVVNDDWDERSLRLQRKRAAYNTPAHRRKRYIHARMVERLRR